MDGPYGMAGALLYGIILTNTSAADCDLGSRPPVSLRGQQGPPLITASPGPTPLDGPGEAIRALRPGQATTLELLISHACDARRGGYDELVVRLDGGDVHLHADRGVQVDCGAVVGGFR